MSEWKHFPIFSSTAIRERSFHKIQVENNTQKNVINEMKNDYFLDVTLRVSFHGVFEAISQPMVKYSSTTTLHTS